MNKKIFSACVLGLLALSSCTNLDETLYSQIPTDDYGNTDKEIQTIVGGAYASLRGYGADTPEGNGIICYPTCEYVFYAVECASDEACIPIRGTDWNDGGRYQELEFHTYKPDNTAVLSLWRYNFTGVSKVNAIIYQIDQSSLSDELKANVKAELRGLRAYYYYNLLDNFGNVPISTDFTVSELPANSTRQEVFNFIESELKEVTPLLPAGAQYGRFTQSVANTLLARLYLNAEVYTGTPRWQDVIDACDKVTGYSLTSDYFASFKIQNQTSSEIIFAIPYDHTAGTLGNYLASGTYHYNQRFAFSAGGSYPWCANGISAEPGLYSSFEEGDVRRASLLIGQQYSALDGSEVLMDDGTPLDYIENIDNFKNAVPNAGARLNKYEWSPTDLNERDNDWVLMRYAEVVMMQAEANFRLGREQEALNGVNQIRQRAGLAPLTTLTLEDLDKELRHEFVFEGLRRTTNIRFGTFYEPMNIKTDADPDHHTGIFPIPAEELAKNGNLKQNPGY